MGDFITLTCPTCGGKLQITPGIDRFSCAHCGNEHIVKRSEGMIAIQPLAESLTGLKRATDRTASEMAIRRLAEELAGLQAAQIQAGARVAACEETLKAHRRGRRQLVSLAILIPMSTASCLLFFLAQYLRDLAHESSILAVAPRILLIATAVIAIITTIAFLGWLNTPTIGPSLQQSRLDLVAAQENLQSVELSVAALEAELARHRSVVTLDK